MPHSSVFALIVLYAGLAVWFGAFPIAGWSHTRPQTRDRRATWGIALEVLGLLLVWFPFVHREPIPLWRVGLALPFLVLASVLSWTATRTLGRFLRFSAALDADHQLVRGGPYRIVRHPIYASMLCILFGVAAIVATPLGLAIALPIFLAGTEVRVRVEDGLLASRFGAEFQRYRQTTAAYIPGLR